MRGREQTSHLLLEVSKRNLMRGFKAGSLDWETCSNTEGEWEGVIQEGSHMTDEIDTIPLRPMSRWQMI